MSAIQSIYGQRPLTTSSPSRGVKSYASRLSNSSTPSTDEQRSSRRSSNLSFMRNLLSNEEQDTSDSGINSIRTTSRNRRPRTSKKSSTKRATTAEPPKTQNVEEKVDVLVLLGNEKNVNKIELLTNQEYDLYHFRGAGYIPKVTVFNPRTFYLDFDHNQVEKEKAKYDYRVREGDSTFVDPFDRDEAQARPKTWRRKRAKSQRVKVFRCVSRANPKNTLKNADRTKSISEHLKELKNVQDEEEEKALDVKKLSREELAKSAQRLSRQKPKEVEPWEWQQKQRKAKTMEPHELEKSVLRLSRLPRRTKQGEKIKTVHDGKVLTDAEIEKISTRLYSSRFRKIQQQQNMAANNQRAKSAQINEKPKPAKKDSPANEDTKIVNSYAWKGF